MAIPFIFDEDSRSRAFKNAINQHNCTATIDRIEAIRVGDTTAPPCGSTDRVLVEWAALNGRVIVTSDANTLISEYDQYTLQGNAGSGLVILLPDAAIPEVIETLRLVGTCCDRSELHGLRYYVPSK